MRKHNLGSGPIEERYYEEMNALAGRRFCGRR